VHFQQSIAQTENKSEEARVDQLNGIVAFVRVVEHKTFAAAARRVGETSEAVSKALTKLESQLGVKLIARTKRSGSVTPAGAAFFVRCRQIVDDIEEARLTVVQGQDTPHGLLRLRLPSAYGHIQVMPRLARLLERWPGLNIDVSLSDREDDFLDRATDVFLHIGPLPDTRWSSQRLATLQLITAAAPSYFVRHRAALGEPEHLRDHNCIRLVDPKTDKPIPWQFRKDGIDTSLDVAGNLTVDRAEALTAAAAEGVGIIQASDFLVRPLLRAGRLKAVLAEFASDGPALWALYPENRLSSPKVRAFLGFMTELVADAAASDLMLQEQSSREPSLARAMKDQAP
jgi:LysR family transcriptional regulator, regulator for bpeEF and oprC